MIGCPGRRRSPGCTLADTMPRQRTGTLSRGADGVLKTRVTVDNPDGTTSRPWFSLGTTDEAIAMRKRARLLAELAAGKTPDGAASASSGPDTVAEYVAAWLARRKAQGLAFADAERGYFDTYAVRIIGPLLIGDVKPAHVRSVLDAVMMAGRKRATVAHVRGVLNRIFGDAWRDELIEQNPVARVVVPPMNEVRKERAILTDEEIARYLACEAASLEVRMLSVVARCEGGMRTGDLHAWDWTMISTSDFAECTIPRQKTRKRRPPQRLDVPEMLRPFLRAWWEKHEKPTSGPVFPVRVGERAGQFKGHQSYAEQLRRDLFRAGVYRMPPVAVPATSPGTRTDLGKKAAGTKLAPHPLDPLYCETATSLPVDFHSFRRAFNTALAASNVNVQRAMTLAGHSDPRTHMNYVMTSSPEMRSTPAQALPCLARVGAPERPPDGGNVLDSDDSGGVGGKMPGFLVDLTGIEPATSRVRF